MKILTTIGVVIVAILSTMVMLTPALAKSHMYQGYRSNQ